MTQAAQDDRVAVPQSIFDLLQDRLDDFLCLDMRQISLFRHAVYHLGFPILRVSYLYASAIYHLVSRRTDCRSTPNYS